MIHATSRTLSLKATVNVFAGLFATLGLIGCATDYKAVREGDLSQIEKQLATAERALAELQQEQAESRELLFMAEQESMRRMLVALEEQIEGPECPVVEPSQPQCEIVPESRPAPQPDRDRIDDKLIIGQVEKVYLDPPGLIYQSRIDTGAETSSLDAREVQIFERDGEEWVRFKMPTPDDEGLVNVERKISHFVRILQASSDESERRPVVKMRVLVGSVERLAEFNLSDREHLEFAVLIGRNVLQDSLVVDVSRSNSASLPQDLPVAEPNE